MISSGLFYAEAGSDGWHQIKSHTLVDANLLRYAPFTYANILRYTCSSWAVKIVFVFKMKSFPV